MKQQTFTLTPPSQYTGPQAIINSDRVLINAKNDTVLIFSKNAIGLSTAGSLHFNSDNICIINSPKIQLGINATEPILLGNKTVDLLTELLESLNLVGKALSDAIVHVGDAEYPVRGLTAPAVNLTLKTQRLLSIIKDIKSKQNFTL